MKKSTKIRIPGAYISPYTKQLMDCFLYGRPKKEFSKLIDSAINTELEPNLEDVCNQLHIKPLKLDITQAIINLIDTTMLTTEDDQKFTIDNGMFSFEMIVNPNFVDDMQGEQPITILKSVGCSSNKVISYIEGCEMDYNLDTILESFI